MLRFQPLESVLCLCCVASFCLSVLADNPPSAAIPSESPKVYDIVVYGGTSSAVVAAVESARQGKSVIVVSPDKHLGGLSSGGLGFTDSGNTSTVGGLAREFYHRIYLEYQKPESWNWQKVEDFANVGQGTRAMKHSDQTMWIFEPHVAERVFENWIAEFKIPVVRQALLNRESGVSKINGRIVSIQTLDGKKYYGRMFIDATYEGDLMAAAGVEYTVGREANRQYGEDWNGNQVGVLHHGHWFKAKISPYNVPGNPDSGKLKYIDDSVPGVYGEADDRIQAYCYRLCLTDCNENRIPFPKPDNYNPKDYELLRRVLDSGWREAFHKFDMIPNRKTDTNNHGPFSSDFIGMNYDYPDASYARRAEILKEHENYQKGLFYFLANDPGVPGDVRNKMSQWGLAKDEFPDTGGWPHQIYVREARRMVGSYVVTENDCFRRPTVPAAGVSVGPVGMGSYTLDSHNARRYVTSDGYVQNEGDIGVHPKQPYAIDYNALIPKRGQCANLLVPVCVSSSHIAFGSIRMEPVFMILGQSSAAAASLAIDENVSVQDVSYPKLAEILKSEGQILEYSRPAAVKNQGVKPESLKGIVVDDAQAVKTGDWQPGDLTPFVGDAYLHDGNTGKASDGKKSIRFEGKLPCPGHYELRISYCPNPNRASNALVVVETAKGPIELRINQKKIPPIDGLLLSLGEFEFDKTAVVTLSNDNADGYVIADAIEAIERKDR